MRAAVCSGSQLFTWAAHPIEAHGDVRDVAVGPYNVVAPGVTTGTPLAAWAARGTFAVDADASGSGAAAAAASVAAVPVGASSPSANSAARKLRPDEFYWRHLPREGAGGEGAGSTAAAAAAAAAGGGLQRLRVDGYGTEALPTAATSPAMRDAASLDCHAAKTAEMLAQASFVVRAPYALPPAPPACARTCVRCSSSSAAHATRAPLPPRHPHRPPLTQTWLLDDSKAASLKATLR